MNLQTKIPLEPSKNQIDYKSQVVLLGSCFSENIGGKLEYFKFQCTQNPFGVLFHPLAIENLITRAVEQRMYAADEVFFENERWHCFDAHSDLSNPSKEKLLEELNCGLEQTHQQFIEATHVLITFGTAWVYRINDSKKVVANCHKIPQKKFSKELRTIDEIQISLENCIQSVRSINPDVHFIFTVSPVRHLKDGFVENQRSKAHLITAIHELTSSPSREGDPGEDYFPSYELMMDELRDYRFYKPDMVHPNQLAIDYIWEKFKLVWIPESANAIMERVDAIQKGMSHRPFNPDSAQHHQFLKSLEKKITYLQQEYGFMTF